MDRWLRFSGTGAHLLWRVKNAARSVPFRQLRTLKDGSELVLLRESGNMLGRRRKEAGDRTLPRLAGTVARLVCFTVLTRTRRGRTKTAAIRVLTTLLDPDAFPAAEIAALYAARWQVEVGHRWHRSSCVVFSWLFSLLTAGFLSCLCPAGAVVVAGRACPAFA
jgi:IS4 transposase